MDVTFISICNDIYPLIAKKYETTKMCVDRAMRRCFENVLYFASKNENNFISYSTVLHPLEKISACAIGNFVVVCYKVCRCTKN